MGVNKLFLRYIELILAFIGGISSILTVVSYFFPTTTYPITQWLRNIVNKRLFAKQTMKIILYKNYCYNNIEHELLRSNLKKKFSKFNFISEYEDGIIKGKLNRQKFNIEIIIDDPKPNDGLILFKQEIEITFKELYKAINVMFDVYRDFEKLDDINEYDNRINFIVDSDSFSNSKFIKDFGDEIQFENFSVKKFKEKYEITITDEDNQEAIDKIEKIIMNFIEI